MRQTTPTNHDLVFCAALNAMLLRTHPVILKNNQAVQAPAYSPEQAVGMAAKITRLVIETCKVADPEPAIEIEPITDDERGRVLHMLTLGFESGTIAYIVGVTPGQVAAVKAHRSMGHYDSKDTPGPNGWTVKMGEASPEKTPAATFNPAFSIGGSPFPNV